MADLDDFFAKKDRKKAKGKKFTTTEEIAKKLEETGKRVEKPKPKDKPANPEEDEVAQTAPEEDEWREFEEEKKDYTGLKIGNLAVTDNTDGESEEERGTGENSSDGEATEAGGKQSGPWKKQELPEQKETVGEAPPAGGGSYKAPHLRNVSSSVSTSSRSRMRKVAPDINSEEYFPTLSGKQPQSGESGPWGRWKREEGNFEEVRNRGGSRGYSMPESQGAQAPKLSLGNKYGALSQDQS
ncbi:protein CDV3 homolog [Venturia canescens]|uniref:protein CDV3 homolog n=1 Tax=Venturia canescens TaxID=32260 RepID=UPI001C9C3F92|nr:protein CDV3 homolog [Venturia canescens]